MFRIVLATAAGVPACQTVPQVAPEVGAGQAVDEEVDAVVAEEDGTRDEDPGVRDEDAGM